MGIDVPNTTRDGFPTLWGQGEIADYANALAQELGLEPLAKGRTWTWDRLPGFPAPVARLQAGNVWLAEEMVPWIEDRLRTVPQGHSTTRIPDDIRRQILAEKGKASQAKTAAKFHVAAITVSRIWRAATNSH